MEPQQNKELSDLLAACGQGDRVAFARLYEATSPKLFGVAVRMLRREDLAAEVLQECYVSIWTNARMYTAALSAPMTWMTSIVRNRCLDTLRRPRMEVQLAWNEESGEDPLAAIPSEEPGPLAALQQSSDAKALAACLAKLDGKMRQAIMLAFFEGLSHSELASHMQQPLGTVKTWIRRGLERLKSCLGESQ